MPRRYPRPACWDIAPGIRSTFCHSTLVYRSQHLPTERAPLPIAATLARLPGALDAASLGAFMMLIDPRALPPKKTIRRD
ncbi:hypothetical protein [Pseudomonas paraeruginosa]|uniref:hypothetical protein n=1 Tax=Pseudomonas paraeruginosa TaxID=2994495 RepID=UPI0039FC6F35